MTTTVVRDTLFGREVVGFQVPDAGGAHVAIAIRPDISDAAIEALAAYAAGLAASRSQLHALLTAPVPIDIEDLVTHRARDLAALETTLATYRQARRAIDELFGD